MYLIQGLIGTYVFDIRLGSVMYLTIRYKAWYMYSIQGMLHAFDTRLGTYMYSIQVMVHVFNTRYGTGTKYKAWNMYLIQGMVKLHLIQGMAHVYDVFDTRHGTFIQYIQGMEHVFNTMHDLWIQYFFKA